MRHYYISHDNWGFRWKSEPAYGWNRFTDNVSNKEDMQNYLTLGRKLDGIDLTFVDKDLHKANIFEVHRSGDKISAVLNAEKRIPLHSWDFLPN
jgi:hypothetical protein